MKRIENAPQCKLLQRSIVRWPRIGLIRPFSGTEKDLRSLFQPIAGAMASGLGVSARTILLILQAKAFR